MGCGFKPDFGAPLKSSGIGQGRVRAGPSEITPERRTGGLRSMRRNERSAKVRTSSVTSKPIKSEIRPARANDGPSRILCGYHTVLKWEPIPAQISALLELSKEKP